VYFIENSKVILQGHIMILGLNFYSCWNWLNHNLRFDASTNEAIAYRARARQWSDRLPSENPSMKRSPTEREHVNEAIASTSPSLARSFKLSGFDSDLDKEASNFTSRQLNFRCYPLRGLHHSWYNFKFVLANCASCTSIQSGTWQVRNLSSDL